MSKYIIKKLQPAMGHRTVTTEQAGEQMPMPVRCVAQKGAGRRCCRKHSGVPRNSASLLETCTGKAMEQKGRENRERNVQNQFGSTSSSLPAILSSSSSSSFYRSRRNRSALNFYLPYLTTSILLGT